jgi:hypothetical protein
MAHETGPIFKATPYLRPILRLQIAHVSCNTRIAAMEPGHP